MGFIMHFLYFLPMFPFTENLKRKENFLLLSSSYPSP
uniref:Uncharacterized protein n=1 Tax=Arundo donax TaxID=35708 RepID=A0A0A8ZTU2_ARUDO